MTKGEAICQEFCTQVEVGFVQDIVGDMKDEANDWRGDMGREFNPSERREEIKCFLDVGYFIALLERMVQVGYCCTQVQKDLRGKTCVAWFEPRQMEEV